MSDNQLKSLRDELDIIDVEIQSLLTRRAEVSLEVRKVKQDDEVKLKPGREAQILRALIERHKGHFPKPELIRIWREILSASLQAQGAFSVGVYVPENGSEDADENSWGYFAAARGHYGTFTPMIGYPSQRRVIEAVIEDECSIGVLPVPGRQEDDPWWRHLAIQGQMLGNTGGSIPPRIISRLPFAAPGGTANKTGSRSGGQALNSLVIAKSDMDPSGLDCTYIGLDLSEGVPNTRIDARIAEIGLTGSVTAQWHDDQMPERWLSLLRIDGYFTPEDASLLRLSEGFGEYFNQATVLGGYAVPISTEALAPSKT
tara:strand:- start:2358 stop:3302 length:945 start_codon:yes stop_codon:yes gene_type:complete